MNLANPGDREGPTGLLLKTVRPEDAPRLYGWYCDFDSPFFWHLHRRVLSYDRFVERLGTLVRTSELRLVIDAVSGEPVACFLMYWMRPWDGWSHLGIYAHPRHRDADTMLRLALSSVQFAFGGHPMLRKVYVEAYGFAPHVDEAFEEIGFVEEGVTPDHIWFRDRYWPRRRLALYRETWEGVNFEARVGEVGT